MNLIPKQCLPRLGMLVLLTSLKDKACFSPSYCLFVEKKEEDMSGSIK